MAIKIGYKKLVTINLLHAYYADWRSPDLVLLPTQETLRVLKNYNLLAKSTDNGMVILASITKDDGTLKVPIPDDDNFKLTFYLQSKSTFFYNRTNLPLEERSLDSISPSRRGYYFDNLNENTFKPAGYPGTEPTLKQLNEKSSDAVSDSDEVYYIPTSFRVNFGVATNAFTFDVKDEAGVSVIPVISINETESFNSYEIDLSKEIPPGYYQVSIDGAPDQKVYISNEVFHNAPFAVVEILQNTSVPLAYDLVKSSGTMVNDDVDYFIWFNNRAARWRYVFGGTPPASVTKPASTFNQTGNIYESNAEIDLKEDYATITMDKNGETINVTNPDGSVIKAEFVGNNIDYFFAEVHL